MVKQEMEVEVVVTRESGDTLSTEDWFDAAKALLIREGVSAVKIGRIAKECNVTRGGFYWRFQNRRELLDALLDEWRTKNSTPLLAALRGEGTPTERFERAVSLWIEERDFDPLFDAAVKRWAASDEIAAAIVRSVEEERIAAFQTLFEDAGYPPLEALVRARVTYLHQVGYYTLQICETREERRTLSPLYHRILTGFSDYDN